MKAKWNHKGVAVAGVAIAMLAAACGSTASGTASKTPSTSGKAPIVLGVDLPLSGPLVSISEPTVTTWKAFAAYTNSHGGVDGHQIKLDILDDASSASQGATNLSTLINSDHVEAILGGEITSVCQSEVPIAERSGTPLICVFAPPEDLFPPAKNIFYAWDPEVNSLAAQVALTQKLVKGTPRIGIVAQNLGGPIAWASAVKKLAAQHHWQVVSTQFLTITSVDVGAQAAALAGAKPNIVYFDPSSFNFSSFYNDMTADGLSIPVLGIGAIASYQDDSAIKSANLYQINPVHWVLPTSQGAGVTAFRSAMAAQGVTSVNALNGPLNNSAGWLGIDDIATAAAACNACGGSKLISELQKVHVTLAGLGSYGFTATRHYPFTSDNVYQWSQKANAEVVIDHLPAGVLGTQK